MRHRRVVSRVALGAALALAAAAGCQQQASPAICSAPQGSEAAARSLAESNTTFAVAFYPPAAAAAGAGQNVILSPYSASAVLTMLDVGAAGETATQIQSVLDLPASGAAVAPTYAALACDDETHGSADGNQLSVANSLWGQKGTAFQASFLSTLATGYGAPLQQVDFVADAAGATSTIDQWVSDQTQGAIPTLFQPGDLDSGTKLVLVNAVYFKGTWATGFDPSATSPQPFTLSDGTVVSVPTMDGTVSLSQGTGPGFSVVELPYQGGQVAIDFLVPDGALTALEASLTPTALLAALGSLEPRAGIEIQLPRFSFTTRVVLNPVLEGMGMPDAFTAGVANLSGIDGAQDLYVSVVVQQAMIEVDEQGTVAAAATGVGVGVAIALSPVQIDHPFLFLLRDTSTGSVLFMGRVEDPRAGS
jgi:serpin B